jgi:hypothetical protein
MLARRARFACTKPPLRHVLHVAVGPVVRSAQMLRLVGMPGTCQLTAAEKNLLRRQAAKNGFAVNTLDTQEQIHEALMLALDSEPVDKVMRFVSARVSGE